ncbi:MAG TPA: dienelactone hydrolase [Thermoanaerobaculia bacterium]|nr:dienelactone hydrolase [Thermoanaerobaculia bacterium]
MEVLASRHSLFRVFSVVLLSLLLATAGALRQPSVGFQQQSVSYGSEALGVAIWYPSRGVEKAEPVGLTTQSIVRNGPVIGNALAVIVISHGTGGSSGSHVDTAMELARGGFVVVAVTHKGDNFRDSTYAGNRIDLIDRPKQVSRVLTYILDEWAGRKHVDRNRAGVFGCSLGGYTALVAAGGTPTLSKLSSLCSDRPEAPECAFIRSRHGDQLSPGLSEPRWVRDKRIKAVAIEVPAVGFVFDQGGLRNVRVPVQIWSAELDDQAPNAWSSDVIIRELPLPPEGHRIRGANHFAFIAPCTAAGSDQIPACQDAPGFDRVAFHRQFNRGVVRFFRKWL